MNNDEIAKLAREYAEDATKTDASDPNLSDTDIKGIKHDVAEYAEEVISWLLRTHCIVPKSLVMEEYNDASTDIEESIKYNMRISEAAMGKKELLESLFDAETFKNSEV